MRVLLIEPDTIQARLYTQALTRAGHAVVHARSALDAVHLADKQTPDVVVLEMQLPAHNGVEFLYEFRSYDEWLRVPVIVHSFVPPAEMMHAATLERELGVARLLYKPTTSLAMLCSAVQSVGSPSS